MKPDVVAILVGGTLAINLVADRYYAPTARQFGQARIMTLPGFGTGSIDRSAEQLNLKIAKDFPGYKIAACCHSQAGLELTQCALDNPNIVQVAAVGTPFHGTWAALTGWPFMRSTSDMLPGSAYLARLHQRLPELTRAKRLATVSLRHDGVVPWPSSRVNGARNYFCGTLREYEKARRTFPDTRHITVSGSQFIGHILGLQALEPELAGLLARLWKQARISARRATRAP